MNGTPVCWPSTAPIPANTTLEYVEPGLAFVCGLTIGDRYVVCWGAQIPPMPSNVSIATIDCCDTANHCCVKYIDGTIQCFYDSNDIYYTDFINTPKNCTCKFILQLLLNYIDLSTYTTTSASTADIASSTATTGTTSSTTTTGITSTNASSSSSITSSSTTTDATSISTTSSTSATLFFSRECEKVSF